MVKRCVTLCEYKLTHVPRLTLTLASPRLPKRDTVSGGVLTLPPFTCELKKMKNILKKVKIMRAGPDQKPQIVSMWGHGGLM